MKHAALLSSLFALACGQRYESAPCDEAFWARRPVWAEQYFNVVHTSDNTTCSSTADCPHSIHYCLQGRCRAWCDRDSHCPTDERCQTHHQGSSLGHPGGVCMGMTGPDAPGQLVTHAAPVGGLCVAATSM